MIPGGVMKSSHRIEGHSHPIIQEHLRSLVSCSCDVQHEIEHTLKYRVVPGADLCPEHLHGELACTRLLQDLYICPLMEEVEKLLVNRFRLYDPLIIVTPQIEPVQKFDEEFGPHGPERMGLSVLCPGKVGRIDENIKHVVLFHLHLYHTSYRSLLPNEKTD